MGLPSSLLGCLGGEGLFLVKKIPFLSPPNRSQEEPTRGQLSVCRKEQCGLGRVFSLAVETGNRKEKVIT